MPPVTPVALEPAVRKIVEARKITLVSSLEAEETSQLEREKVAKEGREKIVTMRAELAEIDAFLARN